MEQSGRSPGGDPYEVLGVAAEASRQDIVRAYRRAVHGAHPDAQPADPKARARFQALTDAYDVLSDTGRRADYDRRRAEARRQGQHARTPPPAARGGMPGLPLGAPLWAGPVRVDPPAGQSPRHDQVQARPSESATAAELLDWYLDQVRGWWR